MVRHALLGERGRGTNGLGAGGHTGHDHLGVDDGPDGTDTPGHLSGQSRPAPRVL
ncbi:MAG: hypothetical protein ACTSX2_08145 [Candidatus Thorarchaeota archaeon]